MPAARSSRIIVVDDHPVVCNGLCRLVADDSRLSICGTTDNAGECISLVEKTHPDMLLLDISLKGSDGIELTKKIRQINPHIVILIFSMHDEELYAERALNAGANGYVMKQEDPDLLLKAIHQVLGGEIFLSPAMTGRLLRRISEGHIPKSGVLKQSIEKLSDRELEVFELIGKGMSTRRIAEALNLSVKTVETYRMHIKEKFDLNDAAELAHHAVHWVEVGLRTR
ncbi:MAG TPA: response regulator transcription factor [Pontiellaceae bacterium]|nr:response regulator transcription factor [Pontiellaceae bacterium]HPR83083.1 response regulator transcription factor [Pontiellaceae bacterium]